MTQLFNINQRKGSVNAHSTGANALLNLRTIDEYASDSVSARLCEVTCAWIVISNPANYLLQTVFWQQLHSGLQAAQTPPLAIHEILTINKSILCMQTRLLMQLVWREVVLRAEWHAIKRKGDPLSSRFDLQMLIRTSLDLENELSVWEATLPPEWLYQRDPNTPEVRSRYNTVVEKLILGTRGAPKEIHSFTNIKKCWVWGFLSTLPGFSFARLDRDDKLDTTGFRSQSLSPFHGVNTTDVQVTVPR